MPGSWSSWRGMPAWARRGSSRRRRGGGGQGAAGAGSGEAAARWRSGGGVAVIGGCVDVGGMGAGYAPLLEVLRRLRTELDATVDDLLADVAPELLPLVSGHKDVRSVGQDAVLAHTLALFEAIG